MSDYGGHSSSTSSNLPLRSALKSEEDGDRTPPASGTLKAVQIAEPVPESHIDEEEKPPRQFRAGSSHRLSGKLSHGIHSTRSSISEGSPALRPADDPGSSSSQSHHHHRRQYYSEKLLAQVSDWLERERQKATTKTKKLHIHKSKSPPAHGKDDEHVQDGNRRRADSIDSESSEVGLDKLQRILEDSMASMGLAGIPRHAPRFSRSRGHRLSISRPGYSRVASSDTDYVDGDAIVPDCDVWLDNSKTLAYSACAAGADDPAADAVRAEKERKTWLVFRNEIIRIAHTLRLKGWRQVPLDDGDSIEVQRLSGALTNAVYVVTPPKSLMDSTGRKPPHRILLRIYGPQAESLIDRENELKVLQRLARKRIGPRLLGTFKNGRFEQFFNAVTLTPRDLRDPETSRQIAKRMRELHDGIELLPLERESGPGVWKNWDQWRDNVARIIKFLDKRFEDTRHVQPSATSVHAWQANGYVCGMPADQFIAMVDKYRSHVNSVYESQKALKEWLVFAHNDTQYGNILRIRPDDEKSPLLQAANKHKQLVVIDFEYAAANVPGIEFANHFTEWTYNYHDAARSYSCNTSRYPTPEEQHRFVKAYIDHRPQFPAASATPRLSPLDSSFSLSSKSSDRGTPALNPTASSSSITEFMLDARVPQHAWSAEEKAREEKTEKQVRELLDEAHLWRPANSAFWVAWGIVQAKIPGLVEEGSTEPPLEGAALEYEEQMAVDEFDYLRYSQERAFFFWGDCVQMGLVKKEDLPEALRKNLKIVEH